MEQRTIQGRSLSRSQDRPAPRKSCLRSSTATRPAKTQSSRLPTIRVVDTWLHKERNLAASILDQPNWEIIDAAFLEAERAIADSDAFAPLTQSWIDDHEGTDPFVVTISAQIVRSMEFQTTVKSYANRASFSYATDKATTKASITRITTATQEFKAATETYGRDLIDRTTPRSPKAKATGLAQHIKERLSSLARRARGQDP